MTVRHPHVLLLAALALAALATPLSAQTQVQNLVQQMSGQEVTQDQILQRLRASGISRAEAQSRLRAAGYDPALLNPYFDRLEGEDGALPETDSDLMAALRDVGVVLRGEAGQIGPVPVPFDSLSMEGDPLPARGEDRRRELEVFGLGVFRRATSQFQPVTTGPVDADYRLGPGDQVILILTGDVEAAYTLDVTREGFLVIPDVGQISVNGLTLEGLRDRLYDRLGQVYSGVRRGAGATTRFEVSLGRLRTNQVFVIGDVARPGAYQISSVGTVMTALYAAGGPTEVGSFRAIRVNRAGSVLREIDLYDYLLQGNAAGDIRLDQGDVVFVPPAGPQVTVQGEVRRPAIYEVRDGEGLRDAMAFAGGVRPEAYVQRVQVDRILPPEERKPGRDRVLLDADPLALQTGTDEAFPLKAGDEITVFGILERQEGRVSVTGDVWRPGDYEYSPGMTLWTLLEKADGLRPSAFRQVVHIHRLIPETGGRRMIQAPAGDGAVESGQDLPLMDMDSVRVFSVEELRTADSVQVSGEVKAPGVYPLSEGATARDLILAAGGFTDAARAYEAEVMRLMKGLTRSDTLSTQYRLAVEPGIPHPLGARAFGPPAGAGPFHGRAGEFVLQKDDQVMVRPLPGYTGRVSVRIQGEVGSPGTYAFEFRRERLSSFVQRAGGLTDEAYPAGASLVRDSVPVGIELEEALECAGCDADIILEPGDELLIPGYDPTVLVEGAVNFPTRVIYREGWGVKEYLSEAGGSLPEADMDRLSVRYLSGSRATTRDYKLFRDYPDVGPGSTVFVPRKPEGSGTNWDQIFTRSLSITTSLLTILVAVDRLK